MIYPESTSVSRMSSSRMSSSSKITVQSNNKYDRRLSIDSTTTSTAVYSSKYRPSNPEPARPLVPASERSVKQTETSQATTSSSTSISSSSSAILTVSTGYSTTKIETSSNPTKKSKDYAKLIRLKFGLK